MRRGTGGARNHSRRIGHTRCPRSSAGSWRSASTGTGAVTRGTVCQRRGPHPPPAPAQAQAPPEICPLSKHGDVTAAWRTPTWLVFPPFCCNNYSHKLTHLRRPEPGSRPVRCSHRRGTGAGGSCGPVCSSPGTTSACFGSEILHFT